MGIDTKGFVATKCKDVFFAVGLVERALNALIQPYAKVARLSMRDTDEPPRYRAVNVKLLAESQAVQLLFTYDGEARTLWMNFACDCDRTEYTPTSISMLMGCWGHSELLMQTALRALSPLGDVYYDYNDCDDIDFAKLTTASLNFVTACAAKIERPYQSHLETWKRLFNEGNLRAGTFEEVLGISQKTAEELVAADWEGAHAQLKALCQSAIATAGLAH